MQKNFVLEFEKVFEKTIKQHNLLNKKEKIIVASSGGKDSAVALYILKKLGYNTEALYINLRLGDYSERCEKAVRQLCQENKIKTHILDIKEEFGMRMCNIRAGVQEKIKISNCMVCGIVKKWILNKQARKLKAKKIVTGHHLDDETQTVIMNFLQGNLLLGANSGPRTGIIEDKKFIPRIKPLYFINEKNIKKYCEIKNIPAVYEKCPCAISSLRIRTREFLQSVDEKTKENIIKNFLKTLPQLKKQLKKEKVIYCENCQEPSRNKICKKCSLINLKSK